ncbi:hypothetical protein BDV59DRAFT_204178 [Aspergillus ambiguus]|uniref:uncharacterized protein n=1 Tax=Aspergillus ambiguus TaxID=176160 RepID=UPI003CCDD4BC
MTQPAPPQVPQHVTALLSHLTSRPGVQSTFILSRKDGSIIQSTGFLSSPSPSGTNSPSAGASANASAGEPTSNLPSMPSAESPSNTAPSDHSSQADILAAHVFAFVSSASDLSLALSRPTLADNSSGSKGEVNGVPTISREDGDGDGDGDGSAKEDDDEVKLLRLRTKKHEIVVVPDRKYLLCVVHDATHSPGGAGGGGSRSSR